MEFYLKFPRYATGHIPNTMLWVGENVSKVLAEARVLTKSLRQKVSWKIIIFKLFILI